MIGLANYNPCYHHVTPTPTPSRPTDRHCDDAYNCCCRIPSLPFINAPRCPILTPPIMSSSHPAHTHNPLLHPPFYLIPNISPNAPISTQVQQIDQLNTLLLQEIDANFAKFHQVTTTKVLPELKRFAIGAEPVRETSHVSFDRSTQYWRSYI